MKSFQELLSKKEEGIRKKEEGKSYLTYSLLQDREEIRRKTLEIVGDLASSDRDFTPWYCKAYKLLGEQKMRIIASEARQPYNRDKKAVFGWLLREEIKSVRAAEKI